MDKRDWHMLERRRKLLKQRHHAWLNANRATDADVARMCADVSDDTEVFLMPSTGRWYGQVRNPLGRTGGQKQVEVTPYFETKAQAKQARKALKNELDARASRAAFDAALASKSSQPLAKPLATASSTAFEATASVWDPLLHPRQLTFWEGEVARVLAGELPTGTPQREEAQEEAPPLLNLGSDDVRKSHEADVVSENQAFWGFAIPFLALVPGPLISWELGYHPLAPIGVLCVYVIIRAAP